MIEFNSEKDWYVSFPLDCDLEELRTFAKETMASKEGSLTVTGEHDTALWWEAPTPPKLKERLEKICPLNEEWDCSVWEWKDGGILNKHSDGEGRGTTFIVLLEGRFEITTYHHKFPDKALDSYQYGPGEIFILKNGHRRFHAGKCLDNYRLAIAVYTKHETDPFRDHSDIFVPWWGEAQ